MARSTRHPITIRRAAVLALLAGVAAAPVALADVEQIPVTGITLYRSGVGYFERTGSVRDDAAVHLEFDTEQINDILKSMVVLDLSGGRVAGVGYASNEPMSRRLGSFAIDLSGKPTVTNILNQIRGANVRLGVPDGDVQGAVLGTEQRRVASAGDTNSVADFVNILTAGGIRSIPINSVRSFDILDADLKSELNRALGELAGARDERIKTVRVDLEGADRRDIYIGYVHAAPVWKTSYRLVLPEASDGDPTLQGWAIVENQTDEDWQNVRLSLVSGSPVGFTMDLYEPLFVERPDVPVPVALSIQPKAYQMARGGGRHSDQSASSRFSRAESPEVAAGVAGGALVDVGSAMGSYAPAAQATGGEVGEVFQYTLDAPVTIERQQSAMLPILTAAIEGRRVSIYDARERPEHPMRGYELVNATDLDLMPGPITVMDAGTYAGDAIIAHTPAGAERLLSYATDLDISASVRDRGANRTDRVRIVDGVLIQTIVDRSTTTYTFDNADQSRERTVIVQHPVWSGWKQVDGPEPDDIVNPGLVRHEVDLAAGETDTLELTYERTRATRVSIFDDDPGTLLLRFQDSDMSAAVAQKLREAAALKREVSEARARLTALEKERNTLTADQARVRENLRAVDRQSDLYARYIAKLNEQETRFEALKSELDAARRDVSQRDAAYRQFVRTLDAD